MIRTGIFIALLSLLIGSNSLIDAVKQRDVSVVRSLLQKRVDVNGAEGDGATALHWAVYRDDAEIVDMLLRAGAKVNRANDLKITPLYLAAVNGNAAIIEKLLKAGAETEASSESGVTPLMEAARTGNAAAVRVLLDHEARVNAKESDRQQTALMWAANQKHPDVVKLLLAHGADVHARTRMRELTIVASQTPRIKASKDGAVQIEAGGSTALLFAAQSGDAESAKLLIAAGADANDAAGDGNSALTLAALTGNSTAARTILEAGANPNANGAGYTALHAAALRGDAVTAKALLAKGANPNVQLTKGTAVRRFGSQWVLPITIAGATPLFVASMYLDVDVVRALVEGGANPTIGIANGTTPLLVATGASTERIARPSDLVRFGIVDSDAPVIPRPEPDVVAIAKLLIDGGADVNGAAPTGDTALHLVTGAGMTTVIQLLADRGANLNAKNRQGQTALSLTTQGSGGGRGSRGAANPEAQSRLKAAEELLRKLGAAP